MPDEQKSLLTGQCDLVQSGPCGLVVFGATGDLSRRKLIPSLFNLYKAGGVRKEFFVLGVGRTRMTDDEFRTHVVDSVTGTLPQVSPAEVAGFSRVCHYLQGSYDDDATYTGLKHRLEQLVREHETEGNTVFSLATPPPVFQAIIEGLGRNGLLTQENARGPFRRLMVEKPFGFDLKSAVELNRTILSWLDDRQVFRVDHYLGKNTVQNILVFRFANSIFEPVWNSNYIDHVQITLNETEGVGHRTGYFEKAGLVRDILQNHMLQLLALVAMERPAGLTGDTLAVEKTRLLKALRRINPGSPDAQLVRGQYTAAAGIPGYRDEPGVAPDSCVETFFAVKLFVDNPRWKDVPFYLRAGKRLDRRETSIKVVFKKVDDCLFCRDGIEHPVNMLTFSIQPEQRLALGFVAKIPGAQMCLSGQEMEFRYGSLFTGPLTGDYERIILDCFLGDHALFWTREAVEESWRLLTPLLERWESCPIDERRSVVNNYPAGSRGPAAADELIRRDRREWV